MYPLHLLLYSTMATMAESTATTQEMESLVVPKKYPTNLKDMLPPALPRAAELLFANSAEEKKLYWDRSHYDSPDSQMKALAKSSTLYVGNLAFSTRSCHVLSHFRQIGPVKMVQMGLDRFLKTPCGFCFVEYHNRSDALQAVANLSGTKLDGRVVRVELDAGFQPGRQYGRGASGGQVRDERRNQSDPGRSAKRQKTLQWTPPNQVQKGQEEEIKSNQQYGSGDKTDQTQERDMNPRFHEE